jgi:putative ABC transport system ATP-binding protein
MTVLLKAENITKSYTVGDSEIQALKGLSLEINEGEFTAIIGKSGSGKSTLMHILGLLDTPTSGTITLKEKNITKYTEKQLAQIRNKEIGFVFQFFNLLPRATSLDNVMLPLKYSQLPKSLWKQKSLAMLDLVGLSERVDNKSNELSGGQKQRVAIARALVNDPSLIFADEPTGNLDSKTGEEITQLFVDLNNQGKTVILVTHDEDLAKVAKRQIVIKDGQLVR